MGTDFDEFMLSLEMHGGYEVTFRDGYVVVETQDEDEAYDIAEAVTRYLTEEGFPDVMVSLQNA